jgi:ketosteroid isomerase-like protein
LTRLTVTIAPKNGGPPVERAGNTLSILNKRAGTWMIARDANMLAVTGAG